MTNVTLPILRSIVTKDKEVEGIKLNIEKGGKVIMPSLSEIWSILKTFSITLVGRATLLGLYLSRIYHSARCTVYYHLYYKAAAVLLRKRLCTHAMETQLIETGQWIHLLAIF